MNLESLPKANYYAHSFQMTTVSIPWDCKGMVSALSTAHGPAQRRGWHCMENDTEMILKSLVEYKNNVYYKERCTKNKGK